MFKQITTVPVIAALLILGGAAKHPDPDHPSDHPAKAEKVKVAELGEPAPQFELEDQFGVTHKLSDYEGKIVVLEWFNDKCPICHGVWSNGLVPKLISDLREIETEVVYLTINSSADRSEKDVKKTAVEFIEETLEETELEVPMLMDYDGKVGHAYLARTTPHMYVIDTEGVLVYQGAISDDRRMKEGADAETHVMRAIQQVLADEDVSPEYVQPWGCSVKYAKDDRKRRPKLPRGVGNPR